MFALGALAQPAYGFEFGGDAPLVKLVDSGLCEPHSRLLGVAMGLLPIGEGERCLEDVLEAYLQVLAERFSPAHSTR